MRSDQDGWMEECGNETQFWCERKMGPREDRKILEVVRIYETYDWRAVDLKSV